MAATTASSSSSIAGITPPASAPHSTASSTMDLPHTAPSTPPPGSAEEARETTGKIKALLGILRKFIGVSDMAAVRFSLPAQLLEPQPNLEYWNYLDRPEAFASIPDSDEPLGRMLAVLRFWFTKDLKYVKGKPCKPYNSILGEFFRCQWEVNDDLPLLSTSVSSADSSSASSFQSAKSSPTAEVPATGADSKFTVSYLTEQTSHHPPISAFWIDCPTKGISACGYDQLSAKFTGTSIKVTPGSQNLGVFITLHKRDNEEYQLTHPIAHLGGLLRGSLTVSIADHCFISCPKTKLKAVLHYVEEGWIGRAQNKVEGVIYRYDPDNDTKLRPRDVPESDIVATISGTWIDKLYYTLPSAPNTPHLLLDLIPLFPIPKTAPPESTQLPNESRSQWATVTNAILARNFSAATSAKQEIEEKQRQRQARRDAEGRDWKPRYFIVSGPESEDGGKPSLSEAGKMVVSGMEEKMFDLPEVDQEE